MRICLKARYNASMTRSDRPKRVWISQRLKANAFKFLRQFGNEDHQVGVECKLVGARSPFRQLNSRYVTQAVERFTNGQ